MDIGSAQRDMARSYVGGAPGVFVSGAVWLVAGLVERSHGIRSAFIALFLGGMLIFPASVVISRVLFKAGKAFDGNPLERLASESTAILFAGILTGYALLQVAPAMVFSAVAVAIGARYFIFRSVYGEPVYWVLGGALALAAAIGMLHPTMLPVGVALLVGAIECAFSVILFLRWKKHRDPST
ncbi:MAG: hypothetical protein J0I47_03375 [Sphingomonas sp.]|uniref:DUF7010 family protein n=1 Tax=Sphingomonas sp. TaxID=28214 RepID=UPI001AC0A2F2|nr:hypothetical protein [Sphingomonas sp.]MBN8807268.1 hypothetical protein [Sphingomonas sp.]